jgi:hypothetical protein
LEKTALLIIGAGNISLLLRTENVPNGLSIPEYKISYSSAEAPDISTQYLYDPAIAKKRRGKRKWAIFIYFILIWKNILTSYIRKIFRHGKNLNRN